MNLHDLDVISLAHHVAYRLLEPARQGDDSPAQRASILRAAAGIADRLAVLHARGWLHADLQSPHIILGPTTVHFIDFALAQGTHPFQPRSDSSAIVRPIRLPLIKTPFERGPEVDPAIEPGDPGLSRGGPEVGESSWWQDAGFRHPCTRQGGGGGE